MLADPEGLIRNFVQVANLSGFAVGTQDVTYEVLRTPHRPASLPKGTQAVYVFSLAAPSPNVLKVGKAGPRSSACFMSHHYHPSSSHSNLAKSLLGHRETWCQLGITSLDETTVGEWIRTYTDRGHFFLDAKQSQFLLNLLEAFLHGRLRPWFEG